MILRTAPGYNLWVGGPTNTFKDGIQAMNAAMETDWLPYTFSVNWKLTRPGLAVRFEAGEPFCAFFPIRRGVVGECEPRLAALTDDKALETAYRWAHSRRGLDTTLADNVKDQFQGWYTRGEMPDRSAATAQGHEAVVSPKPFTR